MTAEAGVAITVSVGRTMARLGRHVEVALGQVDLTIAQYRTLVQLDEGAEASSSLATKLAVSRPSATAVVEGLVQRGLVDRTQLAEDRRWVSVQLTEAGRAVLADADRMVTGQLAGLLSGIGAAEVDLAVAGMTQWQSAVDVHRGLAHAERIAGARQRSDDRPTRSPTRTPPVQA